MPDVEDDDNGAVEMFTDGACLGNPGPGGWGVIMRWRGNERELSGGEPDTTNNRMELQAAIEGLNSLTRRSRVRVFTDSQYVKEGITGWIHRWKQNGWKTAARKPVRNADLWRLLDDRLRDHDIEWAWVRGHAGHPDNERADELAGRAAREAAGSRSRRRRDS